MPIAEAVVQTDDPGRYLARLRDHTAKMRTHLGHRPRRHGRGGAPPEIRHAEWSGTSGTVAVAVDLLFAKMLPSASLSQGHGLLSLSGTGYRNTRMPHSASTSPPRGPA